MNNTFDELTKSMARSFTRRAALKIISVAVCVAFIMTASLKADLRSPVNIAPIHATAGVTAVLTTTPDPTVFIATATGVVRTSLLGTCVENAQLNVRFPTTPDQPVILNGT